MVHLSEAGRVALVIVLLAMGSVGAAWAYTVYNGPLTDEPPLYVEEDGIFLVTYRTMTWEHETPAGRFATNRVLSFAPIEVPVQNVTTVEVILRVSMGGPSVSDEYTVVVEDPVGASVSGSHPVPQPSTEGYLRSDLVITWPRTPQPGAETYQVEDRATALQRSAENRTDPSAKGDWSGTVELNQPLVGRTGNASLLFRMSYYEAIVLPQTRPTESAELPTPTPDNTTGPDNDTEPDETDAPGNGTVIADRPHTGPVDAGDVRGHTQNVHYERPRGRAR